MNDSQIQSEISGEREVDDRSREDGTTSFYIKDIFDKNSQQFWNDVKTKFISKDRQDAVDMIEETLSKYYALKSDTSLYFHTSNLNVTFINDLLIKICIVISRAHKTVR